MCPILPISGILRYPVEVAHETTACPGCGLELASTGESPDLFNASGACVQIYWQLSAFTLSLQDPEFPHQVVVDSYAAQHSGPRVKPITTVFALIGLYLHLERGCTGRQVQLAHMFLGRKRRAWPRFDPPVEKATVTVRDVLQSVGKDNYREPIDRWAKAVWDTWQGERWRVIELVSRHLTGWRP